MEIIKGCPSTSMDDYQLNLTTMIKHAARNFPEREIIYRTPQGIFRYTYQDAYRRIQKLANALEGLGVKPGDRIGVLDWNTRRHYELYYAIPGTGAVLLQMNLRLAPVDLVHTAGHSQASLIFVDESLLSIAEAIAPDLPKVKAYVVMTEKPLSSIKTSLPRVHSYEELLENAGQDYQWPVMDEKSAYSACYTSGTTGKSKGVYYSHRAIYLHTLMYTLSAGFNCHDSFIQLVPMFHAQGWGQFQCATFAGSKIILPGQYSLDDLKELLDLMIEEKVTIANGAPAIFLPMLNCVKQLAQKPDFHGTRFISGATEPPLNMMKEWRDLTGAVFCHIYGSTETAPLVTLNFLKPSLEESLSEDEKWDLMRKQGIPVSGLDLKTVDFKGNELPHDGVSIGEILVRAPWATGSYFDDTRNQESFLDGYWRSGDAATIDPHGYVKLVDRYKDLIKSGGEWISSVDLENAIMAHPAVLEATVIGLPHPKWEERPLALVVLKDGRAGRVGPDDILDFIRPAFAKWQLPDQIKFVTEIPKTSVGKFDKKVIRNDLKDVYGSGPENG